MAIRGINVIRAGLLSSCLVATAPAYAQTPPSTPPSAPAGGSSPTGDQAGSQSSASEAPASATPASGGQVEDIVVTAQRVQTSLQKTPISVTAYSGRELEAAGSQTVRDLILSTPNLQEARPIAGDGTNAVFFLRGLGLPRGSLGVQPAVGVYIDDFYYPSLNGAVLRLLDLSSVEILRGPQGTLFGRNTLGGAIRYNTRQPSVTDGFSGHIDGTLGRFDRRDISGSVNVPLGQMFALRLSAARFDSDGFITDVDTGHKVGGVNDRIGRAQLRFAPSTSITNDLTAEYSRERYDGSPSILVGVSDPTGERSTGLVNDYNNGGLAFPPPGAPPGTPPTFVPPATDAERYDDKYLYGCKYCQPGTNLPDYSRTTIRNIHNTLAVNLSDDWTIKSLTGYFDVKTFNRTDLDHTPVLLVENVGSNDRDRSFSQELQLSGSTFDGRLKLIGGLYYFHEKFSDSRDSGGYMPGAPRVIGPVDESELVGDNVTLGKLTSRSYAAYAQAALAVTDKLTATVGGRYSRDVISVSSQASPTVDPVVPPTAHFHNFSPAFKLQYQWTPTVMTYASASRGYRSGTINTESRLQPELGLSKLNPDTIWSYEIGTRTELLDRHLQLNLTGFTSDYKGVQLLYAYPPHPFGPPVPPTIFANAGNATVSGVEFETRASAGPFQLRGSAAYLDAHYTKLTPPGADTNNPNSLPPGPPGPPPPGPYPPVPPLTPISLNSHFQHAPAFTYSLGVSYFHSFGDMGLRLALDYSHQSSQRSTAQDADSQRLPAYGLMNFRANLDITKNWSVAVGVQNIFNKYYFVGGADLRSALGPSYLEPGSPRTWSVSARFQF